MGLKLQVIKGVSWNMFEQVSLQVLSFGVTIVLARLLNPADYGLVALSAIFVGFISMFEDLAMGSAIIQRSGINDDYISTSFWTSVLTGFGLSLILIAIAPIASWYYNQPLLKYIIMLSAVSLLISPIYSIHKSLLTKELAFDKLVFINLFVALISGTVSITLALLGKGVWSLVLGSLVGNILVIPIVWHLMPWRPKLLFKKNCFKDLFGFSSNLLAFNIFNYFARNFDNMIIGKILGASVLGIYSVAYNLMMKPLSQVSASVGRVLFPAFSSIQNDIGLVRLSYLKAVKGISFLTFPMMTGLMMVSREFILAFMGPRWEGAIIPLQLLCLVGAMQSIGTTVGTIFNSQGRSDLQLKTGIIASTGAVIAFLVGIRWGLIGLIKGYIIASIFFFFFNQYFANRLIQLAMKDFLSAMKLPVLNSAIMVLALAGFRLLNENVLRLNIYGHLATSICIGVLVYASLSLLFLDRRQLYDLKAMLRNRKKSSSASGECNLP